MDTATVAIKPEGQISSNNLHCSLPSYEHQNHVRAFWVKKAHDGVRTAIDSVSASTRRLYSRGCGGSLDKVSMTVANIRDTNDARTFLALLGPVLSCRQRVVLKDRERTILDPDEFHASRFDDEKLTGGPFRILRNGQLFVSCIFTVPRVSYESKRKKNRGKRSNSGCGSGTRMEDD